MMPSLSVSARSKSSTGAVLCLGVPPMPSHLSATLPVAAGVLGITIVLCLLEVDIHRSRISARRSSASEPPPRPARCERGRRGEQGDVEGRQDVQGVEIDKRPRQPEQLERQQSEPSDTIGIRLPFVGVVADGPVHQGWVGQAGADAREEDAPGGVQARSKRVEEAHHSQAAFGNGPQGGAHLLLPRHPRGTAPGRAADSAL
eukprot:scaffold2380_cov102-Isochrysis_galbana.AAC.13